MSGWFGGILEGLAVPINALAEGIKNVWDGIISVRDNLVQGFTDTVEAVTAIPEMIGEKVRLLLTEFFVPDEELMNERLQSLRSEFAFVDSIAGYGDHLLNTLQGASGKAPSFTIDFGKARGKYIKTSQTVTIDLSWYDEYKPMVDNILSGLIWMTFLWHMYKKIPDIIHGNSMSTAAVNQILKK